MPRVNKLTLTAMMAAVMCICSWLAVPFVIPFTMQTFAVFCTLLLLGGKYGTLSVAVYLLMGAVGLPVFSGFRGGIAHLLGPTGGYLFGFIFSGLCYMLLEPLMTKKRKLRIPALILGLLICYLIGTVWFWVVYASKTGEYSLASVAVTCALPYVLPDALKMLLAIYVSDRINTGLRKR